MSPRAPSATALAAPRSRPMVLGLEGRGAPRRRAGRRRTCRASCRRPARVGAGPGRRGGHRRHRRLRPVAGRQDDHDHLRPDPGRGQGPEDQGPRGRQADPQRRRLLAPAGVLPGPAGRLADPQRHALGPDAGRRRDQRLRRRGDRQLQRQPHPQRRCLPQRHGGRRRRGPVRGDLGLRGGLRADHHRHDPRQPVPRDQLGGPRRGDLGQRRRLRDRPEHLPRQHLFDVAQAGRVATPSPARGARGATPRGGRSSSTRACRPATPAL